MISKQIFAFWPKATVAHYDQLIKLCGNLDEAFKASEKQLLELKWQKQVLPSFLEWRKNAKQIAEKWEEKFIKENISFIVYGEENYPNKIFSEDVYDPPYVLFIRGNARFISSALAVVGSRKCTSYGLSAVKELVPEVAKNGVSIISGLAKGIDSAAHRTALDAGGYTIAVLGHGLDWADFGLEESRITLGKEIIASGGSIISEYLPGTLGANYTFPARNRIIAGLTKGTLLVEGKMGSGALITMQCARDYHREIMVVPHNIFSTTGEGVIDQLKQGAHPITHSKDIFEILKINPKKQRQLKINVDPQQNTIIKTLQIEPQGRDNLARELSLSPASLGVTLTTMELSGFIEVKNGLYYAL
ncbi:MAG: DNA-processing protein DprA [Candidatus Magasanikbacteria bacterium]|nr:DNA-processing protein DprA [Candidatus Magasanikbacteria bacterium]